MVIIRASRMLRSVLCLDAASCAVMGALLVTFDASLAQLLSLPRVLLLESGALLLLIAACLAWLASRELLPRALVWTVIVMNTLWTAQSCGLLLTAWVAPNVFGHAFVLAQAAVTGALAALEYAGLRRSSLPA